MINKPKVSLIVPVYNGANYMCEAIDSALAQTYENVEVIVVNDGSKDDGETDRIARSYGDRIRYFDKPNGGVATALNLGIEKMTGEYMCWLSHDDIYNPNKIEVQMKIVMKRESPAILYSDYEAIDEEGMFIKQIDVNPQKRETFFNSPLVNARIHTCSLLIPSEAFKQFGDFDEKLLASQDYHMLVRLLKKYELVHVSQSLMRSRWHAEQVTVSSNSLHEKERNEFFYWLVRQSYAEKLLKKSSSFPKPWIYLKIFFFYCQKGLQEAAFLLFYSYINLKESSPELLQWMGRMGVLEDGFRYLGDVTNIVEYYQQGIKYFENLDSLSPLQKQKLASLYKNLKNYKQAKCIFQDLLICSNNKNLLTSSYFHLGEISLDEGHKEEARKYFQKCLKLTPGHRKCFEYLRE